MPVAIAACALAAPIAAPSRVAPTKESLARAPSGAYSRVRVGAGASARLVPQPAEPAALFARMAAPVQVGDAVFVACQVEAIEPMNADETLELTTMIGGAPEVTARTSPFAITGVTLAAGQPLRIAGARTSSQCDWSVSLPIPLPQKNCTSASKPLAPLSIALGATLPAKLGGPALRAECRGLDQAGVEREASGPLAAAEQRFGELCARMRIDASDPTWGWPEGSRADVVWSARVDEAASLLGFADPRIQSQIQRHAAAQTEWTSALGAWVRARGAELSAGAISEGEGGAKYRVSTPMGCGVWPFAPADAVPLGQELPSGSRACWFDLEVQNGTQETMAVAETAGGLRVAGALASLRAVTERGEPVDLFLRGVDRGRELRYVSRVDEKIAAGGTLRLVVTAFLSAGTANGKGPLLLGVGRAGLLRLR